jgi:hypothetical protein
MKKENSMKVQRMSFVLPATAFLGLCLVGLSMVGGTSSTFASEPEIAAVWGGQCGSVYTGGCGTSCANQVHMTNCTNDCCTGLSGFGSNLSNQSFVGMGTTSGGNACGGTCGAVAQSWAPGCG